MHDFQDIPTRCNRAENSWPMIIVYFASMSVVPFKMLQKRAVNSDTRLR